MQEVKIKFDFSNGPIWKEKYDIASHELLTGIDILDNDEALTVLNDRAKKEYSSLYSFGKDGRVNFDKEAFEKKKLVLYSLVKTIILRMNDLNDGSFVVIDEISAKL